MTAGESYDVFLALLKRKLLVVEVLPNPILHGAIKLFLMN